MTNFVGILEEAHRGGMVRTTGKDNVGDIFIPETKLNGAPFGMLVVVEVAGDPPFLNPQGAVTEVIGDPALPNVAMTGIIREYGLHEKFSAEELAEAEKIPSELSEDVISSELARGRKDLRTLRTITIDGKDAKDLDDAISIMPLPDHGYRLWIHIADVCHYIKEDSILDQAALLRGNSVYLADRVLPMLPPHISNGICSINPHKNRLTLTCMLEYNALGIVTRGEVFESIIKSDLRANYEDVYNAVYNGDVSDSYKDMMSEFILMRELADLLKQNREAKGSLNFEFPETKVVMNADGTVADIMAYPINAANGIIEEFMIAANVFVGKQYHNLAAPFLYRVHEKPDPIKMGRFLDLARVAGIKLKGFNVNDTLAIAKVLDKVNESPLGPALSQLLLQSLAKARYDSEPLGHFGLAEEFYSHFTAPIRRYPDVFIHRVIKGYISGQLKLKKWKNKAPVVAEQTSLTERNAMYAEFASVDQKIAEYMKERIGETFTGQIVGMMPAGVFIRLPNTVEGMLPFRLMDDYYEYDELRMEAVGSRNGRALRIGQSIEVLVARADTESRQVDFAPVGTDLSTIQERPRRDSVFDAPQSMSGGNGGGHSQGRKPKAGTNKPRGSKNERYGKSSKNEKSGKSGKSGKAGKSARSGRSAKSRKSSKNK